MPALYKNEDYKNFGGWAPTLDHGSTPSLYQRVGTPNPLEKNVKSGKFVAFFRMFQGAPTCFMPETPGGGGGGGGGWRSRRHCCCGGASSALISGRNLDRLMLLNPMFQSRPILGRRLNLEKSGLPV